MVKPRVKKAAVRAPARKRIIRKVRRERAVLPPARSILGNIWRTIVQTAWDITQGALRPSISVDAEGQNPPPPPTNWSINASDAELFAYGWQQKLSSLFRETKVHRIIARYLPYGPVTQVGEYIFTLWDSEENQLKQDSFRYSLNTPGSVVRKSGQPAKLTWFPTEPSDREWHVIGDKHQWCSSTVTAAETEYKVPDPGKTFKIMPANIAGQVVIDVDASFRGRPPFNPGSQELMNYQLAMQCECRKCRRLERLRTFGLLRSKPILSSNLSLSDMALDG